MNVELQSESFISEWNKQFFLLLSRYPYLTASIRFLASLAAAFTLLEFFVESLWFTSPLGIILACAAMVYYGYQYSFSYENYDTSDELFAQVARGRYDHETVQKLHRQLPEEARKRTKGITFSLLESLNAQFRKLSEQQDQRIKITLRAGITFHILNKDDKDKAIYNIFERHRKIRPEVSSYAYIFAFILAAVLSICTVLEVTHVLLHIWCCSPYIGVFYILQGSMMLSLMRYMYQRNIDVLSTLTGWGMKEVGADAYAAFSPIQWLFVALMLLVPVSYSYGIAVMSSCAFIAAYQNRDKDTTLLSFVCDSAVQACIIAGIGYIMPGLWGMNYSIVLNVWLAWCAYSKQNTAASVKEPIVYRLYSFMDRLMAHFYYAYKPCALTIHAAVEAIYPTLGFIHCVPLPLGGIIAVYIFFYIAVSFSIKSHPLAFLRNDFDALLKNESEKKPKYRIKIIKKESYMYWMLMLYSCLFLVTLTQYTCATACMVLLIAKVCEDTYYISDKKEKLQRMVHKIMSGVLHAVGDSHEFEHAFGHSSEILQHTHHHHHHHSASFIVQGVIMSSTIITTLHDLCCADVQCKK